MIPRWNIGATVGKFNPPHLGHLHLIREAASRVGRLFVLLCAREDQSLQAAKRREWLLDAAPSNVEVLVTSDDLPAENPPWAGRALSVLPERPDVAFTSEDWGEGWARLMGAEHVLVDRDRLAFPISGTELRADLGEHFHWLLPEARRALARRVVLVGAESTGKSTLAEALARRLRTVWVPEHGRWYWEGRRHLLDQSWSSEELRRIATGQLRLENDLARSAVRGIVVSDTDALVTSVWHERYLGFGDSELERLAEERVPDLYLVCCPDFPWIQDGTRESEELRADMHAATVARVETSGARFALLAGTRDERLAAAMNHVMPLTRFPPLV